MEGQIDNYFKGYEPGKVDKLKVDIPGSFLDPNQVPPETREYLVDKCKKYGIKEIEIETRPEFVSKENLSNFKDIDLTVAIGLDVADDYYLKKLNKGFSVSEYEDSTRIVKSIGFEVKTYVLVNPPFVDDAEEILDKTVREALNFSDVVVLINCYPHEGTALEEMMSSEETEWKPLSKEDFFKITKKWLVKPNIEYDVRKKEVPPAWKAWVPRFSDREKVVVTSEEEMEDPRFVTWQNFLVDKYNPPESKDVALFIPHSSHRPFGESNLLEEIDSVLEGSNLAGRTHKIMLSSPGVVPVEFADYYPFGSFKFDFDRLTEEAKERYVELTKKRLKEYIQSHKVYYEKYFSIFKPESLNNEVVNKVAEDMGIEIGRCCGESNLTSEAALEELKNKLEKNV